jgi:N-acetylmuramoyl-L-alanine amidase
MQTRETTMVKFLGLLPSLFLLGLLSTPKATAQSMPLNDRERANTAPITHEIDRPVAVSELSDRMSAIASSSEIQLVQNNNRIAEIKEIEISNSGNQLIIRANRTLTYTSGWESAFSYTITIDNARLASGVREPSTSGSDTISQVRIEETGDNTVVIRVRPAPQVQIEGVNQPSPQMLSLSLRSYAVLHPSPNNPDRTDPSNTSIELPENRQGNILIVLDPGHGGNDPGAVGIGGLDEVEIVTPVSLRVGELLEQQGIDIAFTRTEDVEVDLPPRVSLANRLQANLFVSIHANAISMSRPEVNGIETYYFSSGKDLAFYVHESLIDATGSNDRGVRTARFYVLRNTDMPAILIELGFVTGDEDARNLSDPDYREILAQAIARGILEYVREYCPGPLCES